MKVIIYDSTAGWLSTVWALGAQLFVAAGRADRACAVRSWDEVIAALAPLRDVTHVETWLHGAPGVVFCDSAPLTVRSVGQFASAVRPSLAPGALWWWRACSVFADQEGRNFGRCCALDLNCRVAGHTFVTWLWHSGLHVIAPGEVATWDLEEGLDGDVPLWSWPWRPNTIMFWGRGPK